MDRMKKKIVITGGPGTGKTTLVNKLIEIGIPCLPEISREITLQAREQGIEQLFLEQPLLFSPKLIEGRTQQFHDASKFDDDFVFLDRGLPDVVAYMDFIGDSYPEEFVKACEENQYEMIFIYFMVGYIQKDFLDFFFF
jgi:predicted ATPase